MFVRRLLVRGQGYFLTSYATLVDNADRRVLERRTAWRIGIDLE